jgi:hypothetical protein
VVESALEVPEDALCGREMGLTGVVHVEAHLLDRVGDVKLGEDQVLERPDQAVVGNRVADRGGACRGRPWPKCRLSGAELQSLMLAHSRMS